MVKRHAKKRPTTPTDPRGGLAANLAVAPRAVWYMHMHMHMCMYMYAHIQSVYPLLEYYLASRLTFREATLEAPASALQVHSQISTQDTRVDVV